MINKFNSQTSPWWFHPFQRFGSLFRLVKVFSSESSLALIKDPETREQFRDFEAKWFLFQMTITSCKTVKDTSYDAPFQMLRISFPSSIFHASHRIVLRPKRLNDNCIFLYFKWITGHTSKACRCLKRCSVESEGSIGIAFSKVPSMRTYKASFLQSLAADTSVGTRIAFCEIKDNADEMVNYWIILLHSTDLHFFGILRNFTLQKMKWEHDCSIQCKEDTSFDATGNIHNLQ